MSKTIGEKIRKMRIKKGVSQAKMAEKLGISQQAYSKYEIGVTSMSFETALQLAEILDISLDELGLDYRDNSTTNQCITEKYPQLQPIPEMRKIPLLGAVACGEPIYREEDEWISLPNDIDADFCLHCVGDSMINARINDGDIVFIQACDIVDNGQIAAVSIDNEVTLKRVYYYPEKNKLVLSPENPAYEPFVYSNDELNYIRILGKAVVFLSRVK